MLILGLIVFSFTLFLFPARLEQPSPGPRKSIDPETLIDNNDQTLAANIPTHRIPEYTVDQFQYLSTRGTVRMWKILAEKAYLYQTEKIVHTRAVTAYLYDDLGKITVIQASEGKYFMNERDLELFGKVHAVLSDGFELDTEYMKYQPDHQQIIIPIQDEVHGRSGGSSSEKLRFRSQGMVFDLARAEVRLPSAVRVEDLTNFTTIDSDQAIIDRHKKMASFLMIPSHSSLANTDGPFVQIDQKTLFARSKRAELKYADQTNTLNYLTLFDEVLIKEKTLPPEARKSLAPPNRTSIARRNKKGRSLRYATAGRAAFDAKKNTIRLTEFPQAYQDDDTVTGEVMIFHRNSDLIEIEQSNSINQDN